MTFTLSGVDIAHDGVRLEKGKYLKLRLFCTTQCQLCVMTDAQIFAAFYRHYFQFFGLSLRRCLHSMSLRIIAFSFICLKRKL